ncbi:hypothetical protein JVX92_15065 (plasmid) [Microbacterium hominis]|uniref:hypothetical protein n=1 Tax=Microbacterium hominis TaxID=162426 RepID=UPI001965838A|nr:hypothetical protein [Microbacterium hominis]QRY42301.1 hypothetical protein JVX92_15065 [Microbacterium hominis]
MLVEGDVRSVPAGAGMVRFRDSALIVDRDDAVHWVLRCVTPAVLLVSAGASAYGLEVRHAADALLDASEITAKHYPRREASTVTRWLRDARTGLLRDADEISGRLESRGSAVRFLALHGSVSGMLEARFATLVDVVALVRDLPGTGPVVTDAYRAAVAAICRSVLLAQLCMDRKLVPDRLDEAYGHACVLLEAMSQ